MFVIARAIAWGRQTAILTSLGNAFGMLLLSIVIALGLGPILQQSETLLTAVQVFGGLYLIYLGYKALKHRQLHADDMVNVTGGKPNYFVALREGFMVGVMNPKALVFFSAVFPQFLEPELGSITVQLLLFGLIFCVLCFFLDGMWGVIVGTSRNWFADSKSRLVALRTAGGIVMVTLGVLVIIQVVNK